LGCDGGHGGHEADDRKRRQRPRKATRPPLRTRAAAGSLNPLNHGAQSGWGAVERHNRLRGGGLRQSMREVSAERLVERWVAASPARGLGQPLVFA
jgi:hypothetical protein